MESVDMALIWFFGGAVVTAVVVTIAAFSLLIAPL